MKRLIVLLAVAFAASAETATRLSWETFAKDPARVASFRKAVAVMKARNTADPKSAEYRTSWQYWGAIHGYFGTDSPDGTIEDYIQWMKDNGYWQDSYEPYFEGVNDMTPPDATAQTVWAQCQHGTPWFYAWHRLYLFYFEKVLQAAAEDPNLRLPYWDYTDPDHLAMPAEFTTPTYTNAAGEEVANPLYEIRRAAGWDNSGTNTLDANSTDIDSALEIETLLDTNDGQGYQSTVENAPHGYVHCAVMDCPATVMGAVPYSSNDPIFWVHHCNIDRTWSCWTSIAGHKNPTASAFVNKKFSFVDATGTLVTNSVSDLFNGSLIDYVYEREKDCQRPAVIEETPQTATKTTKTKAKPPAKPEVLARLKKVAITSAVAKKTLTLPSTEAPSGPEQLALAGDPSVRTELVLSNIHYDAHPGTMFNIFLERKDDPQRRAFLGTLSFFVTIGKKRHEGHGQTITRTFDASEALKQLAANGGLDEVNVVFEATTGRVSTAEAPVPAPRLNPKANLTIDEMKLHVKGRK